MKLQIFSALETTKCIPQASSPSDDGDDGELLAQCLFAAVRVFARRPAAAQHTLGRVLELCGERGGPELAKRAAFYATLLSNSSVSKSVLFSV